LCDELQKAIFKKIKTLTAGMNIFNVTSNKNARLAILFASANSLALGIWSYTVLSGWLQMMPAGSNSRVGIAEGVQGTVQGLVAIPAGYLADKIGREVILKWSSVIGLLSVASLILTLVAMKNNDPLEGRSMQQMPDTHHQFEWMTVSLGLVGMYTGIYSSALEAIFHDSINSEDRLKVSTAKYIADVVFNAAGPITSLILFLFIGDTWAFDDITMVMLIGVVLSVFPIGMLFLFKDKYCLGSESEALNHMSYQSPENTPRLGGVQAMGMITDLDEYAENQPSLPTASVAPMQEPLLELSESDSRQKLKNLQWWIPRVLVTSDMISGLASGMTIKFFPLFFKDETNLPPSATNLIFALSPLLMVLFSTIAMKAAKRIGRVQVPLITGSIGISLLVLMWFLGTFKNEDGAQYMWQDWRIIVPIYLLRTAVMNCAFPLKRSILMDYVRKDERGKWSSLESITQFGWSGSAVVGGWLSDNYGYGGTFLATAALQAIALALFSTLKLFKIKN